MRKQTAFGFDEHRCWPPHAGLLWVLQLHEPGNLLSYSSQLSHSPLPS